MAPSIGTASGKLRVQAPATRSRVVVTATARLARELARSYDASQIEAGRTGWTSPDILPFDAWLGRLWRDWLYSGPTRPVRLLAPAAEQALWEQIIASSADGRDLFDVAGTAAAAAAAWRLLWHWEVPLDALEWGETEDTEAFRGWARELERRLDAGSWLSGACLARFLSDRVREAGIPIPASLVVEGFDELPPAYRRLLESLGARGTSVEVADENPIGAPSLRVALPDRRTEIRASAAWARERLGEGARRIGIVVPDLARDRETIEAIFHDLFNPGSGLDASGDGRLYHVSIGRPLADYPVIEAALDLLQIRTGVMPLEAVGRWLRSPFLGGAREEGTRRALLGRALARRRELDVSLGDILDLAGETIAPWYCRLLEGRLRDWRAFSRGLTDRRASAEWVQVVSGWLETLGWPGDGPLDSHSYQARLAWDDLLSEFAGLDAVLGPASFGTSVLRLRKMAAARQFQPESDPSPVQIVGMLEAGGLRFEHLWILGMDNLAWPGRRLPNPFLPLALQREHELAGSSPERHLESARRLTRRLLASAESSCVVSHARTDSGVEAGPSPLVRQLPEAAFRELVGEIAPSFADAIRRSARIEVIADDQAPFLRVANDRPVAGGTRIFADQAACPFRAFARWRLGAGPDDPVVAGLDARDRGQLVHDALERVWTRLRSRDDLMETPAEALDRIVGESVDASIRKLGRRRSVLCGSAFAGIERARLTRLVVDWLELEKGRADFEVIATEGSARVDVGGLELIVRVDRVDALPDGSRLLIDYKSGNATPRDWEGERPADPQLPVYALVVEGEGHRLSGICFALVRKDGPVFRGVAVSDDLFPGIRRSAVPIGEMVGGWKALLDRLAREFRDGAAGVDPVDGEATCRHCNLRSLCRIDERRGLLELSELRKAVR